VSHGSVSLYSKGLQLKLVQKGLKHIDQQAFGPIAELINCDLTFVKPFTLLEQVGFSPLPIEIKAAKQLKFS
jgi:hypothetical protein